MVSCKDVGGRLGPFLRGELSFPDRFATHRHLANCPRCARVVEEGRDALNVSKSALSRTVDPVADEVPEQLVRAILVTCRGAH